MLLLSTSVNASVTEEEVEYCKGLESMGKNVYLARVGGMSLETALRIVEGHGEVYRIIILGAFELPFPDGKSISTSWVEDIAKEYGEAVYLECMAGVSQ